MASIFVSYSQCDPTNLIAYNETISGATLSWNAPSATNFQIKWRIHGSTSSWSGTNPNVSGPFLIGVDSILLDTLTSDNTYEWRIRPYGCTPSTPWWDGPNFTTLSSCNLISSITITDADCPNILNGSIDLTISNGTAPYTFSWSNGGTTEDLSGIANNTYIVNFNNLI